METQVDVEKFFKQAAAIKQNRAEDYDNSSKSAYENKIELFSEYNRPVVAISNIADKLPRLVSAVEKAQTDILNNRPISDQRALKDSLLDIANYAGMAYSYLFKDEDSVKSEKVVPAEPQKFMLKTAETPDEKKINL